MFGAYNSFLALRDWGWEHDDGWRASARVSSEVLKDRYRKENREGGRACTLLGGCSLVARSWWSDDVNIGRATRSSNALF